MFFSFSAWPFSYVVFVLFWLLETLGKTLLQLSNTPTYYFLDTRYHATNTHVCLLLLVKECKLVYKLQPLFTSLAGVIVLKHSTVTYVLGNTHVIVVCSMRSEFVLLHYMVSEVGFEPMPSNPCPQTHALKGTMRSGIHVWNTCVQILTFFLHFEDHAFDPHCCICSLTRRTKPALNIFA